MASSIHSAIAPHSFLSSISKPKSTPKSPIFPVSKSPRKIVFSRNERKVAAAKDLDVISSDDVTDQKEGVVVSRVEMEGGDGDLATTQVSGFGGNEGLLSLEGFSSSSGGEGESEESMEKLIDRTINATIVLAAGTFAITKLLTIDHDYWHGWTLFEILRYAPQHNWSAYEDALKTNPVFAKMVISGVVYSVGDWIAQGKAMKSEVETQRKQQRMAAGGNNFSGVAIVRGWSVVESKG